MHTEQAFDALERIINAAAHEQFSDALIQNAREALKTLRAECDLLDKRSVAQLEITRAAAARHTGSWRGVCEKCGKRERYYHPSKQKLFALCSVCGMDAINAFLAEIGVE